MKLVVRILLLSLFAGVASAEEGAHSYLSIRPLGQGFAAELTVLEETQEPNRGWAVGGALGSSLNDYFMIDLISVDYVQNNYAGNDASALNIITELKAGFFGGDFPIKPYVAGGIGAARVNFDFSDPATPGFTAWGLAWEVGGGIDYPIPDQNISLGLFYRYRTSVSMANNWQPVPSDYSLPSATQALYDAGWEYSYHAIGLEIRFGGVRGL